MYRRYAPTHFGRSVPATARLAEADGSPSLLQPSPRAPSDQVAVSPHARLEVAPVIDGSFVQLRQVVRHPNIDECGVAYVDGADLVRLLSALPPRFAYADIPSIWRGDVPPAAGSRIASWLWEKHVLVPAT